MRIAILSDIHANLEALEAVLDRAKQLGAETTWVLGDMVGYGADPVAVVDRIRDLGSEAVCGNHDLVAIKQFDVGWFNDVAAAAAIWTIDQLNDSIREWLTTLSPSKRVDEMRLVHGSVRDPVAEYITDIVVASASFDALEENICFFGHTHLPAVYTFTPTPQEGARLLGGNVRQWHAGPEDELSLAASTRYLINPGSVGQPRDGDPRASFVILDGGTVSWHRVEYPIESAQKKILDAGLPPWLAQRLALGR
jgi:diadenosine tetraphosphatase ApaH/serine/threonine PP2A family protein phosphatase